MLYRYFIPIHPQFNIETNRSQRSVLIKTKLNFNYQQHMVFDIYYAHAMPLRRKNTMKMTYNQRRILGMGMKSTLRSLLPEENLEGLN